jgi:hypothetical protein
MAQTVARAACELHRRAHGGVVWHLDGARQPALGNMQEQRRWGRSDALVLVCGAALPVRTAIADWLRAAPPAACLRWLAIAPADCQAMDSEAVLLLPPLGARVPVGHTLPMHDEPHVLRWRAMSRGSGSQGVGSWAKGK